MHQSFLGSTLISGRLKYGNVRRSQKLVNYRSTILMCSSDAGNRDLRPSNAETAKTVVSTVNHGTLSTISEDGTPLGTYVAFVLDKKGCPVLRLRSDAVHKRNLEKNSKCSLFVHAPEEPARKVARVTLIGYHKFLPEWMRMFLFGAGNLTFVDDEDLDAARADYQERHPGVTGVDQLRENDRFGYLNVDKVFYIGGISGNGNADVVSGQDFIESEPDPLRLEAIQIVKEWNRNRIDDIIRICKHESKIPLMELTHAELAWVDRLGFYIVYDTINSKHNSLRIAFPREVEADRDARSLLTMAAHLAWEADRTAITSL